MIKTVLLLLQQIEEYNSSYPIVTRNSIIIFKTYKRIIQK